MTAPGGVAIAQQARPPATPDPILADLSRAANAGDVAATQQALTRLGAAGRSLPPESPGRFSPLHLAVLSAGAGALQVAELLLQHGAAIDARGPEGGTPLYHAIARQRDDRALWLLDRGARPDVPDTAGVTPLERAVSRGAPDAGPRAALIRKLLAVERTPDRRDAS